MKSMFQEHFMQTALILVLFFLSVLSQIAIAFLYQNMIKETHNMSSTKNKVLKKCRMKFANCYELHEGISNVPVFVEKYINDIKIGGISLNAFEHISGQLLLFAIFLIGTGVCKAIATNETLVKITPYYILAFVMIYVYYAVAAMVDMKGKRNSLKTNLIDYLENTMSVRLVQSKMEQDRLQQEMEQEPMKTNRVGMERKRQNVRKNTRKDGLNEEEKEELENLLRGMLLKDQTNADRMGKVL